MSFRVFVEQLLSMLWPWTLEHISLNAAAVCSVLATLRNVFPIVITRFICCFLFAAVKCGENEEVNHLCYMIV